MKKIFILILLVFCYGKSFSQNTEIEWQRLQDSAGANSIIKSNFGGYMVLGSVNATDTPVTNNHGLSDLWINKLDELGNLEWEKCFGGSNNEFASVIQQTRDSGYIIGGFTYSSNGDVTLNHGTCDYWILKIDSIGSIEWQKSLGGIGGDILRDIIQTNDGGYIAVGESKSNDGDVNGNYGEEDFWVVKLDSSGSVVWGKNFGGSSYDYANSVLQNSDSGYIVVGRTYSTNGDVSINHGLGDVWIIRIDKNGNLQSEKTYGGSNDDQAAKIIRTTDNNYLIVGATKSSDGDVSCLPSLYFDTWVLKIDSAGSIIWQACLGRGGNFANAGNSVVENTNNEFYIAMNYQDYNWPNSGGPPVAEIYKIDSIGGVLWYNFFPNPESFWSCFNSILVANDGGCIAAGWKWIGAAYGSQWIVKLSSATQVNEISVKNDFNISPNPTTSFITIESTSAITEAEVSDIAGRVLLRQQENNVSGFTLSLAPFQPGIYLLRLNTQDGFVVRKVVKE